MKKYHFLAVKFKVNEENLKTPDNSDYEEEEDEMSNVSASEMEEDATDEPMHGVESTSNTGWADVMQKILKTKKPKGKKTVVLAKAKKLCDVKVTEKEEDISFEIDGVVKGEKTETKEAGIKTAEHTAKATSKVKEKSLGIRVKPSIADRERERLLQKIVTKYVTLTNCFFVVL